MNGGREGGKKGELDPLITVVCLEWATAIPRSGGEKNSLEFFWRKPLYPVSCLYAIYVALLGWLSGSSVYTSDFVSSLPSYALSEVKEPIKTVKRAAPLALLAVSELYMLVNIAYMAAVPKEVILSSNRLLAAEFMSRMLGESRYI